MRIRSGLLINWPAIGYGVLCVAAPLTWGLLVVQVSNMIERRLRAGKKPEEAQEAPPIEYHI
jgi:hypothetical protein